MCKSSMQWGKVVYSVRVVGDSGILTARYVYGREVRLELYRDHSTDCGRFPGELFNYQYHVNWRIQAYVGS